MRADFPAAVARQVEISIVILGSIFAFLLSIRSFSFEMNSGTRIHSLLVALSCVIVSAYFTAWGLIPMMSWTR